MVSRGSPFLPVEPLHFPQWPEQKEPCTVALSLTPAVIKHMNKALQYSCH